MTYSSPSIDLSSGFALGRYELLLPIAKGGMAQVWAARLHGTRGFQKVVAIKTILSGVIDDARMEEMFLAEAELAAQIHHPNVVGTIDLGEHDGVLYLVMEWVDGESLNQVMSKAAGSGGVPLAIGVNLIGQACKGLHAAHSLRDDHGDLLGVVHRDVSPQNVLVTFSGTAKLVDFGIAKATSKSTGYTEAGEVKGKFAYMAPEQIRAQPLDSRADLFSLGILLYQITTGKHPFRGDNHGETLQNICADRGPAPPSAFLPDYPAELEEVVLKALAKDPAKRFVSANELLTALERAMPGPLEASFELQVAEYLKSLFGSRAAERRTALRVAQERIDQQRGESSSSISLGTLRALAIDQNDTPSLRSTTPSLILSSNTPRRITPMPEARPRNYVKRAVLPGIAALAVLSCALSFRLWRSETRNAQIAPPNAAPVAVFANAAQPAVVVAPTPTAAVPPASAVALPPSQPGVQVKGLPHGRKAVRAVRPALPNAAPESSAVVAAPALPSAPPSEQPANNVGRSAFGGRH